MNKIKIMKEGWDYLIILDACRYDYFEQIWEKYLTGVLTKRTSVGSSTLKWRDNSFKEYYEDTIYISSNPYINSIMPMKGFLGSEYFYKVYDTWQYGWDENRGTVLPETVTNVAIDVVKSHKDKRVIIHYLQPHAPYLSLDMESFVFPAPNLSKEKILMGTNQSESRAKIWLVRKLALLLRKIRILGPNAEWQLREIIKMTPASPMDAVRRKYGDDVLRKAYKANLELVLKEVVRLLKYLSGKIVITSDHGELLGENRCYSHGSGSTSPYLIEIPWFIVDKQNERSKEVDSMVQKSRGKTIGAKSLDDSREENVKELIEKKLRALGYFD